LVPMSKDEFREFVGNIEADYAQERSRNLDTNIEDEREVAKRQYAEIGKGFETGNIRAVFMQVAGDRVGLMVYGYDEKNRLAYLYYIRVFAEYRRRGYARAALELLEEDALRLGAEKIGLNVFGDNDSAKRLYERSGYRFAFHGMHKKLRRD
jgi:ribosomal protein S18 acetylase RimI-like enzyme